METMKKPCTESANRHGLQGLLMIVVLAGVASSAQAAVISFSDSWSNYDPLQSSFEDGRSFTDQFSDYDNSLSLSLFDSSLGTLDSMSIVMNGDITANGSANFYDDVPGSSTAGTQSFTDMTVSIFWQLGFSVNSLESTRLDTTRTCTDDAASIVHFPTCDTGIFNDQQTVNGSYGTSDASILSAYTGPGSLDFWSVLSGTMYTAETDDDIFLDGYVGFRGGALDSSGTLTVNYIYTEHPVTSLPEPATLPLFGAGLLGLGLIRRRRRRT